MQTPAISPSESAAGLKRCARCHAPKRLAEYSPYSRARDGRHSYCRECRAAGCRERAARATRLRREAPLPIAVPDTALPGAAPDLLAALTAIATGRVRRGAHTIALDCAGLKHLAAVALQAAGVPVAGAQVA